MSIQCWWDDGLELTTPRLQQIPELPADLLSPTRYDRI